jgi:hypothetical protein
MRAALRILAAGAATFAFVASCGFAPTPEQGPSADCIVTAAPVYKPLAELRGEERFPAGAQLLLVHNGKATPLVPDFAATADADVSYDGKSVLFAGRKMANDSWQIWELTLQDGSVRRVVSTATDAERPFYLPGGRLVWAQRTPGGFQLESSDDGRPQESTPRNPTVGPGLLPLSYINASAFPAGVLKDGRILFEAGFPLGQGSIPELFLVYADGSGAESYRCDHGRGRWGGTQLNSGDVIFTHGTSLGRFTSPSAHEEPVAAPRGEYASAIAEIEPGEWLVSIRTGSDAHYALRSWKPGTPTMKTVFADRGEDLVEPVPVIPRERPHRHPSGLHPWDYANLLALDARLSREGDLKTAPASVRLEAQNASGDAVSMGTAPVEQDGSFFVKVPGNTPIRFALLDKNGAVLRRERGWFWARGGEQRICVGCHTGPERAAENRVPAVLLRTTIPVDLTVPPKSAKTHGPEQEGN